MVKHIYGSHVNINYADVFTMKSEHSYAAFVGVLSNIYMKAHASSPFRSKPYPSALVISSSMMTPYKNQPESSFDRLKFIISKLRIPAGGIELGIYVANGKFAATSKVGLKHTISQCWPIQNSTGGRLFTTVNLPPKQLQSGSNKIRYFTKKDIGLSGQSVKFVDYDTTIKELYSFLENSRFFVGYQGGSAWLSVCMGIPTYIVHSQHITNNLHLKFKLFGQDLGNINILDKSNNIIHVRQHPAEHHINIGDLKHTLRNL